MSLGLQNLWNPFRDWNNNRMTSLEHRKALQNLWNPFRDWNAWLGWHTTDRSSYKTSETLLGIETQRSGDRRYQWGSYKTSETLLGIETLRAYLQGDRLGLRYKTSETLLGIETRKKAPSVCCASYKTSETLLGIETVKYINLHQPSKGYKTSETLLGIETEMLFVV